MDNNRYNTENADERIETFLRGKMNKEEELLFKNELKSNKELRDKAKIMALLIKGLREKGMKKDREITRTKSPGRLRSYLLYASSIAAIFAVIFYLHINHKRDKMLADIVSPYYIYYNINDLPPRGETDTLAAKHLYELFNLISKTDNTSEIIKELEPIYNTLEGNYTYYIYANDIAWNLALAYIKDNQIDKAIVILEKLKKDNPDTPIAGKADNILRRLQEL